MKTISLKLDDSIFRDTEEVLTKLHKSRNRYINEAVDYYNRLNRRKLVSQKLAAESKIVRNESMSVLNEFEILYGEDQAI